MADRTSTSVVVRRDDGGDDGEDVESSSSIPSDRDDDQVQRDEVRRLPLTGFFSLALILDVFVDVKQGQAQSLPGRV